MNEVLFLCLPAPHPGQNSATGRTELKAQGDLWHWVGCSATCLNGMFPPGLSTHFRGGNPTLGQGTGLTGIGGGKRLPISSRMAPGEMLALKCCLLGASPTGRINKEGFVCVDRYGPARGGHVGGASSLSSWVGWKTGIWEKRNKILMLLQRVNTFQAPPLRADHLCAFSSSQPHPFILSTHVPWAPGEQC